MWGIHGSEVAGQAQALGIATSLMDLADGGRFAAFGAQLSDRSRLAFSWSQTKELDDFSVESAWTSPDATALSAGVSHRINGSWTVASTFSLLNEKNGLLGTTYSLDSPVHFGDDNRSMSLGIASAYDLGNKRSLLVDATVARTAGSKITSGLIGEVSPVLSAGAGVSLAQNDAFKKDDRLSLSLRAPMRAYSGSASLAVTEVDAEGYAFTYARDVSLVPDATELNLGIDYTAPLGENVEWSVSARARHNADNIAGRNSAEAIASATFRF